MRDYEALAAIEALDDRPTTAEDSGGLPVRRRRVTHEVQIRPKHQDQRTTTVLKILQRHVDDMQLCFLDSVGFDSSQKAAELVYQSVNHRLVFLDQTLGEYLLRYYEEEEYHCEALLLISTWVRSSWKKLCSTLRIPRHKLNYRFVGFRNAVLDREFLSFIDYNALDAGTYICAYIDCVVQDVPEANDGMPQYDLPILSKIMDTQKWSIETRYLYFAMLGRTWRGRNVEEDDKLELLPMSIGQSGTGKTLTLMLLSLGFHVNQVTSINSDTTDNFSLSHVVDKDVILIDELNRRTSSITNGTWWTIASKGIIAVRQMYKQAVPMRFNMGIWMSGLGTMKLMDKGDFDSFRRRVVAFPFYHKPEVVDRNILTDILNSGEIAHIMHLAESCYRELLKVPLVVSRQMQALMETVAGDLNPLYAFYKSCLVDTHTESLVAVGVQKTSVKDIQRAYEIFTDSHDIIRTSKYIWGERTTDVLREDSYWRRALREVWPYMYIDRVPGANGRSHSDASNRLMVFHCKLISDDDIKAVNLSNYCELEGDTRSGTVGRQADVVVPPWMYPVVRGERLTPCASPQSTGTASLSRAVDIQLTLDNT